MCRLRWLRVAVKESRNLPLPFDESSDLQVANVFLSGTSVGLFHHHPSLAASDLFSPPQPAPGD